MKRFHAIWDTEHWVDGRDYDNLEEAKNDCLETLVTWMMDFWSEHSTIDAKTAEDWDSMINNCFVWVGEGYSIDKMKEVWTPSDKELFELGWVEFENLGYKVGEDI